MSRAQGLLHSRTYKRNLSDYFFVTLQRPLPEHSFAKWREWKEMQFIYENQATPIWFPSILKVSVFSFSTKWGLFDYYSLDRENFSTLQIARTISALELAFAFLQGLPKSLPVHPIVWQRSTLHLLDEETAEWLKSCFQQLVLSGWKDRTRW